MHSVCIWGICSFVFPLQKQTHWIKKSFLSRPCNHESSFILFSLPSLLPICFPSTDTLQHSSVSANISESAFIFLKTSCLFCNKIYLYVSVYFVSARYLLLNALLYSQTWLHDTRCCFFPILFFLSKIFSWFFFFLVQSLLQLPMSKKSL